MGLFQRLSFAGLGAEAPADARKGALRSKQGKGNSRPKSARERRAKGETVRSRRRMAMRPPSFTELLPYVSYDADDEVFLLKDGSTLGALFELQAVSSEAQTVEYMLGRAERVQAALQALPESDASPWVVQFFMNDDRNIAGLNQTLREYIAEQHKATPEWSRTVLESQYTQSILAEIAEHVELVSQADGLFVDEEVTGQPWRGQLRRVRCCIYKRFGKLTDDPTPPLQQLEAAATTLTATLTEAGLKVRRCAGRDLYEWLLPFFNRDVPWARDGDELLRMAPYPGDNAAQVGRQGAASANAAPIYGWDLSEALNLSEPRSNLDKGTFEFDGVPVKAMVLQSLHNAPQIGHFSAELRTGKDAFARFDRLPAGSMLAISITIAPQHKLANHIERIRDASRARNAEAMATYRECQAVLERMVGVNDRLYPVTVTLYVTGPDYEALDAAVSQTNALLVPTGLRFVETRQDLVPLDSFLRGLPFNFDPAFDQRRLRRARLTFASQIAALLPVYGRARGSGNPGFWFWNRGGEPLWIDPLNKYDRKKNAHMLVLGPTGAGKSATLNYLAMLAMAIHRPRLFIIDAGKSFTLLMDYFKEQGLVTHSVTLSAEAEVSLPPFVHALRVLDDPDIMSSYEAAERQAARGVDLPDPVSLQTLSGSDTTEAIVRRAQEKQKQQAPTLQDPVVANDEFDEDEDEEEFAEKRDLLGEMLVSAVFMITGGEDAEIARLGRADRYLISRAIINAAKTARDEGRLHPLPQDIALALMAMQHDGNLSQPRKIRAEEMGQSMMTFTQGLRGKLFNREGSDWPDADVTLVEMGTLTEDGYGDALAVAYTSLMDSVQSRAEATQHEGRPTIFLTDEGHLITTNDLLGPKIAKGTKMWRKLNTWFWLATQNLEDFPGSMGRVLSMCEYWMLLTMDKSEVEQVSRFRGLSTEQRAMVESARKETPKYTEGVLITASDQFLFRNVPPALPIALAMTEGHEKAHRRRLMDKHGCTEMEAARMVARELTERRS